MVRTNRVRGVVTRVELFDWRSLTWVVAFDQPQPMRQLTDSEQTIDMPPILTNRARVTLEQWLPSQHAVVRITLQRTVWPQNGKAQPGRVECDAATSASVRSMLDETLADSLCIGRVCQLACGGAAPTTYTFGRAVKALYLSGG